MGLSNKLLLGVGAGAAALAFVGVGANAAFTDTATTAASLNTGKVGITLWSNGGYLQSDGVKTNWGYASLPNDVTKDSPNKGVANSVDMGTIGNLGSDFVGVIPVNIANSGTLNIASLQMDIAGGKNALAKQTTVSVWNTNNADAAVQALEGTTPVGSTAPTEIGSPSALSSVSPVEVVSNAAWGTWTPGQSHWVMVVLSSPTGGYTNAASSESISPVITMTASDL